MELNEKIQWHAHHMTMEISVNYVFWDDSHAEDQTINSCN